MRSISLLQFVGTTEGCWGSELKRSQEDVRGPAGAFLGPPDGEQEGALILLPRAYSACLFQRGTRSDIVPLLNTNAIWFGSKTWRQSSTHLRGRKEEETKLGRKVNKFTWYRTAG